MTCVLDSPVSTTGDNIGVDLRTADCNDEVYDPTLPVLVASADDEVEDDEELDIEEFDDDDFDDEFDDDFEDEDEGEYDVVEEFEDDFTFTDPAIKKPVTHGKDVDGSESTSDDVQNAPYKWDGEDDAADESADEE